MKKLILLLMALILSCTAISSPLPPSVRVTYNITEHNGNDALVTFTVKGNQELIPGQLYYFDGNDVDGSPLPLSQGIYQKTDKNGLPIFSNFSPVEEANESSVGSTSQNNNSSAQTSNNEPLVDGSQQIDHPSNSPGVGNDISSGEVNYGDINQTATTSAIGTGIAHAIYRGVIYTDAYQKQMSEINSRADADNQEIIKNIQEISKGITASEEQFQKIFADFQATITASKNSPLLNENRYQYQSSDKKLVSSLKEIESILRSARCTDDKKLDSKKWGLAMLLSSDRASAAGEAQEAIAYQRYAEAFADIAIGLDPVTGPIRDIYESITGKNLITGEGLDNYARTFAVLGAVTFGFGSKLGKGLKIFRAMEMTENLEHSIEAAEKIAIHAEQVIEKTERSAHNAADYQKYLTELRANMERPNVENPELKKFLKTYWKDSGTIGNKSTAAAIRYEKITGEEVGGRFHTQKGENSLVWLEKWMQRSSNATTNDKMAAEHIILDLRNALKGDL